MALLQKIQDDLKTAMRAGETVRRDTLRLILADLKYKRIELGEEPDDDQIQAVLRTALKRRKESIEQFEKGGRQELADLEKAESVVIEAYLPQQMSEDDTRTAVEAAVAEAGATSRKDVGAVMKVLMAKHKGQIDGKTANRFLSELLS